MTTSRTPTYIGDGVYIDDDGFQLWLCVGNHYTRVVALDRDVFHLLVEGGKERFKQMSEDN